VFITDGDKNSRRQNLIDNGATEDEIAFLLDLGNPDADIHTGKRVELNAMTSPQFVAFVERKLAQHGIEKVIPDKTRLEDAYRLFVRNDRIKEEVNRVVANIGEIDVEAPDDLSERVYAHLREHPELPWEKAVRQIIDGKPSTPVARKRARSVPAPRSL
jgi:hypothetical protein